MGTRRYGKSPGRAGRGSASGRPGSRSRLIVEAGRSPAALRPLGRRSENSSDPLQEDDRSRDDRHLGAGAVGHGARVGVRLGGRELERPSRAESAPGEQELPLLAEGVEQQQEGVVLHVFAVRAALNDLLAVQEHAEHTVAVLPVAARHLEPICSIPRRKVWRRKTACSRRSRISRRVNSRISASWAFQSYQESSLSWHHALLLPSCVRPISSPPSSIGVPWETSSVVKKLRFCRARSASTSRSSVSPSTPQFQERLSSEPSLLFSRLASLCLCS